MNEAKFIGYVKELPIKPGDRVRIPKGVIVRCNGENKPAGRTFIVRVNHVLNGYTLDASEQAYQMRHGRTVGPAVNPKAVWAGSGGYWCEADINDIVL
jgi:hypothetical protein